MQPLAPDSWLKFVCFGGTPEGLDPPNLLVGSWNRRNVLTRFLASSSHYYVETMALARDWARQYEAIPPGLPTEAVVVFDVPPDATGLTLGIAEDSATTAEPRRN